MKTHLASLARIAALAASLFALSAVASAKDSAPVDRAAQLLAARGQLELAAAGPYVETGTYRVQVAVKLGRPTTILADGTWLYADHVIDNSIATGTLVIRFTEKGRVNQLTLVTPAVAVALAKPQKASDPLLVASRQ